MNPEEDEILLRIWLLYCVNNFCRFANGGTGYRRMDINGFNLVLGKFSFDLGPVYMEVGDPS